MLLGEKKYIYIYFPPFNGYVYLFIYILATFKFISGRGHSVASWKEISEDYYNVDGVIRYGEVKHQTHVSHYSVTSKKALHYFSATLSTPYLSM